MNPFLITKPLRFLVLMISVSLPYAIFFTISNSLDEKPWLICLPIVIGSVIVVAGEFWETITYGWGIAIKTKKEMMSYLMR
jgi:hypothetical protein